MKHIFWIISAALWLGAVASCSGDEPMPPEEDHGWFWPINRGDSLFMADFCKNDSTAYWYNVRWASDDPYSWLDITKWEFDSLHTEWRLVDFTVSIEDEKRFVIPSSISHCEYLRSIYLSGGISYIPEAICDLPNLEKLTIYSTYITSLPDDIFTEKILWVEIFYNPELTCGLPRSIVRLTDRPGGFFYLGFNQFTGAIPPIRKATINLYYNNLTSFTLTEENMRPGPGKIYTRGNRLTGELPPEVIADTLAILSLWPQFGSQLEGYGISGLPSGEEYLKMEREWRKNHPGSLNP